MVTREWSERHIVELIKKNGGGDSMASFVAPTMNFQASPTANVLREVYVTVDSHNYPVSTYYTVTLAGSANDGPMVPSNFEAGQPFVGFMWPRNIPKPWNVTITHNLDMLAGGGSGVTNYTMGSATFEMSRSARWGVDMEIFTRPNLSGTWGAPLDDYQRFWVLEIMDDGVSNLVDNYITEFGENPKYITTWHANSPVPIPDSLE